MGLSARARAARAKEMNRGCSWGGAPPAGSRTRQRCPPAARPSIPRPGPGSPAPPPPRPWPARPGPTRCSSCHPVVDPLLVLVVGAPDVRAKLIDDLVPQHRRHAQLALVVRIVQARLIGVVEQRPVESKLRV